MAKTRLERAFMHIFFGIRMVICVTRITPISHKLSNSYFIALKPFYSNFSHSRSSFLQCLFTLYPTANRLSNPLPTSSWSTITNYSFHCTRPIHAFDITLKFRSISNKVLNASSTDETCKLCSIHVT